MNELSESFDRLAKKLVETIVKRGQEIVFEDERITDDLLRGEALRYFTRVLAAGLVSQVEANEPACPRFIKIISPWLNWGYTNSDGTYDFVNLHGDYEYRIYGKRGDARLFDVELWEGDIADLAKASAIGNLRDINGGKSEVTFEADGSFEIFLSRERRGKNCLLLPEGHAHLYLRQWYYDYETEQASEFYIERIGETFPRPSLTAQDHVNNFERLIKFIDSVWRPLDHGIAQHYVSAPDIVPFPSGLITEGNAFRNQRYARGRYNLEQGQAIIMELTPPKAEYWMFGLMSTFWEIYDYLGQQVSINRHQAEIDDDGLLRIVIAHEDPGVANWLDAGNHSKGLIAGRYNWSEDVPIPALKTVSLIELDQYLPASTKRISCVERSEILARRLQSQRKRGVDW